MAESSGPRGTKDNGVTKRAILLALFLIPRIRFPWWCLGLVGVGSGVLYALAWGIRRVVGDAPLALAVFAPLVVGVVFYGAYVRATPLWSLIGRLRRDGGIK